MRLLVVEDDPMVCMGLVRWLQRMQLAEIDRIEHVFSAEDALPILRDGAVDILLTDIELQGMDGISLVETAREGQNAPSCVILTAFDSFNYAQRALRVGAEEFLLKPCTPECLENAVLKAIEKRAQAERTVQKNRLLQLSTKLYQGVCLTPEQLGQMGFERVPKLLRALAFSENGGQPPAPPFWHLLIEDMHCMLFDAAFPAAKEFIGDLPHSFRGSVGVSSVGDDVLRIVSEGMRSLELQWTCTQPRVFSYVARPKSECFPDAMRALETYRAQEYLRSAERILCGTDEYVFSRIGWLLEDSRNALQKMAASLGVEPGLVDPKPREGAICAFQRVAQEISRLALKKTFVSKSDPVQWAFSYVEEHLSKNISMAVVANSLNLNYSYFSQLFHESTGLSFTAYVRKARMCRALTLLDDGIRSAQVGQMLGYANAAGFTRAFQKYYGFTPSEYRNNGKRGSDASPDECEQ